MGAAERSRQGSGGGRDDAVLRSTSARRCSAGAIGACLEWATHDRLEALIADPPTPLMPLRLD
jgi:hypothetical protein